MQCLKPFSGFPCGQCLPCRIDRRRVWTHRIMLEQRMHVNSTFLTLTYADEHLPSGGTLVPPDVQKFLKRLRREVEPASLRYFLVGEYGDISWRPHYHVALFGYPNCLNSRSRYSNRSSCCEHCDRIRRVWGLGNIMLDELNLVTAQYIAGYTTKKMTSKVDPRLNGRHPEFARMSLKPGIGATAMSSVAAAFECDQGYKYIDVNSDVPSALHCGDRIMPLGRYLKRKWKEEMGFVELGSSEKSQLLRNAKMSSLRQDFIESEVAKGRTYSQALDYEKEVVKQKSLNAEVRSKLTRKRKKL